ncbi:MAG TPA: hypothetical protein VK348_08695 [Planctomycetota bacterium]|nr:hypothetical protein [Planctomycetota bacterium]
MVIAGDQSDIEAWCERSRQNLRAAGYLAARNPPLLYPAVSRIYYACYEAACALLLANHRRPKAENHGAVWRAIDDIRPGLFFELQELHSWRRKADYAVGHRSGAHRPPPRRRRLHPDS